MSINLLSRLGKLEASASAKFPRPRRVVRIVVNEGEEAEAMRQAAETGFDTGPDSNDILIIRLIAFTAIPKTSNRPAANQGILSAEARLS